MVTNFSPLQALKGLRGGVGTNVPSTMRWKRKNPAGMGRRGERRTKGGETSGLDILSINILYPQPPFVSLTPFFSNLINVNDM